MASKYKPAVFRCSQLLTLLGILLVLSTLLGCREKYSHAGAAKGEPIVGPFRAEDENPFLYRDRDASKKTQRAIFLTVYRITCNSQAINLEELWSLLRPAGLIDSSSQLIARNGLRIASGSADDWPKLVGLLGFGPARKEQEQILTTRPATLLDRRETWLAEGFMAELPISNLPAEQMLFWHQPDGRLVGRTFRDCQNLLVVTALPLPTGQARLQLIPAIKDKTARLRSLKLLLGAHSPTGPERYEASFEQLALNALVHPNEFLVVGQAPRASEAGFGAVFFRADQAPQSATTLLLIVPRVITHVPGKGVVQPDDTMKIAPMRTQKK